MFGKSTFRLTMTAVVATLCGFAAPDAHAVSVTDHPVYRVKDPATLGEISILLYGTTRKWEEIALINGIKPPYRIHVGQSLRLATPPIPESEGRRALARMWRKRFALDAVRASEHVSNPAAAHAPSQPVSPPDGAAIPSITPPEKFAAAFEAVPAPADPEVREQVEAEATAQELLLRGKGLMNQGVPLEAAALFKQSREKNPGELPAWVQEIKALRAAGKEDQARETIEELLDAHPEAASFPFISAPPSERKP